ncbi:MAG: protein-L-isoaspartate(D-aspartate) O-methyltransferase [Myxococcota bacterium]|jgi:protein-L-isoaspartate(D-aspartate) O-methyltransferase|nr:protein-L-isoaspartate(D-aspartate) O-methyltransferase [Myxococcota bacterium]
MSGSLEEMVRTQIVARGIRESRVLSAMRRVDRALFVPEHARAWAYDDAPVPLSEGQTISQPYIVAYMTEALELEPSHSVLEIGTGCGYQTAVLAELVSQLRSIELRPRLAASAQARLQALGYDWVRCCVADGYLGFPSEAPFDAILLTAAPAEVPECLFAQLRVGGRLVAPVGEQEQTLCRFRRTSQGLVREALLAVRFVPMLRAEALG